MKRIYCIANQKGGVGKTTTAISLASGFARAGKTALLVDFDPQCNATNGMNLLPTERHPLATGAPLRGSIRQTESGVDVLPGCRSFADIERLTSVRNPRGIDQMTKRLVSETRDYDHVIIDCPPSIGPLTKSALAHSNAALIPVQCEYYAMEGLVQMLEIIGEIYKRQTCSLEDAGVLLTMCDRSLELTTEVENDIRAKFEDWVFKTTIPRDVAFSEASSHGESIIDYAPRSRGARAYIELCLEVFESWQKTSD